MNTFIGMMIILIIGIAVLSSLFSKKKAPSRSGDDPITYDDYVELMCRLDEIQEAIEGEKG